MRAVDLIENKKRAKELSEGEITFLITEYINGNIPDYQIAAFLMAVYFNGMSDTEMTTFTQVMAASGDQLELKGIEGFKIDKHSSGGVGDKVTLVVAPLAAAAGLTMAKMSGRGLGHTGGTIDKLESIKGFRVTLSQEEFTTVVNTVGCAVIGQTAQVAVADKKLYALRDVTATVDSIPLIAASIMSKKLAVHSDGIVLDVKVGDGAFMKTREDATKLAYAMVAIGKGAGRTIRAMITDMNQPLGNAIGNGLEVQEALDTLQGKGPKDITDLCVAQVAQMLIVAGKETDEATAQQKVHTLLADGTAHTKFLEMIQAQGGVVENNTLSLPKAQSIVTITSSKDGVVAGFATEQLGICCMKLGAGRATKEDIIDPAVGIVLNKKIGDTVAVGDELAYVHVNGELPSELHDEIAACISLAQDAHTPPLVHDIIM